MQYSEIFRDLPCYCITSSQCFPLAAKGAALRDAYFAVTKGDM